MRILLAGHPETAAIWEPVASLLDEPPAVWALPGYGTPLPDDVAPTAEGYLAWLTAAVERLGEPVDLVGHDWGGVLALRLASLRPDLLHSWASDALGVLDGDHVWHPAARVWQAPGHGEAAVEAALRSSDDEVVAGFAAMGLPAEHALAMRRGWDRTMWSCALSLYRSAVDIHERWGPDLERASARPGLAIVTDEELTRTEWSCRSAARSGARTARLEGLGHWWLVQDPERGARAIAEFWASLS